MNSRPITALVIFAIVAALIIGVGLAGRSAFQSPEVRAAIAQQEAAKAAELQARAYQQQAQAERAWLDVQTARAAQPVIVNSVGMIWNGLGLAVFVLAIGGAVVLVVWLWRRSAMVYPSSSGQWPLLVRRHADAWTVIDPARLLGAIATVKDNGEIVTHPIGSEAAHLQLATQSQAAAVMAGAVNRAQSSEALDRLSKAAARVPAPVFAQTADGATRYVYVKAPGQQNSEAARDLQDLREFIELGAQRGFSRRIWQGHLFKSGHDYTRGRFDSLVDKLKRANVVRAEGQSFVLAVKVAEALDAFGLGARDEQAGEEESASG